MTHSTQAPSDIPKRPPGPGRARRQRQRSPGARRHGRSQASTSLARAGRPVWRACPSGVPRFAMEKTLVSTNCNVCRYYADVFDPSTSAPLSPPSWVRYTRRTKPNSGGRVAYTSFAELLAAATVHGGIGAAVVARESEETAQATDVLRERMREALEVMRSAIARGTRRWTRSRSGLTGQDAATLAGAGPGVAGAMFTETLAAALATGEVNAAMGRIVAAPTGGASGVLPAVVVRWAGRAQPMTMRSWTRCSSPPASAASSPRGPPSRGRRAAVRPRSEAGRRWRPRRRRLCGGTPAQAGHAASLALQGLLGLVCDLGGSSRCRAWYATRPARRWRLRRPTWREQGSSSPCRLTKSWMQPRRWAVRCPLA